MKKNKRIAVMGLGEFGSSLAQTLADNGCEVIAIDKDLDHLTKIADQIDLTIQADFTNLAQLREAGIGHADIVVIASASHLENTILGIMNCEALEVPQIIVKSKNVQFAEVLRRAGADQVVLPERDMGIQMGRMLSETTAQRLLAIDAEHDVIEFHAQPEWVGKSIEELEFRSRYHVNIIAIGVIGNQSLDVTIKPSTIIQEDHYFLGITEDESATHALKIK